ncbi:hypothetical protein [Kibdelosporangium aridum]|nr:hypothetical protein [Kibdelosporangium aridum]
MDETHLGDFRGVVLGDDATVEVVAEPPDKPAQPPAPADPAETQ